MQPTNYTFASREATAAPSSTTPRRRRRTGPDTRPTTQGSTPNAAPATRQQTERRPERDADTRPRWSGRDDRQAPASDLPPSLFRSANGPAVGSRPAPTAGAPVRQPDRPAARPVT